MDGAFDVSHYRVKQGSAARLAHRETLVKPLYDGKEQYAELLGAHTSELDQRQGIHYADNRYAVLLVFQAMDAAGKDGVIRHVMTGVNPQGCSVYGFRQPSTLARQHDFLWRTVIPLPERGRIGIYNRSYYEEVLVVRVHPELLLQQGIVVDMPPKATFWKERYRSINDFERHLHVNGTRILKFYLHLSRDEQKRRFLKRIDNPNKNWKFSIADIHERQYWDAYMDAYEDCLSSTSTHEAPWHVIPADDKKNARLIVSSIILDLFRSLDIAWPVVDEERKRELVACRESLLAEG